MLPLLLAALCAERAQADPLDGVWPSESWRHPTQLLLDSVATRVGEQLFLAGWAGDERVGIVRQRADEDSLRTEIVDLEANRLVDSTEGDPLPMLRRHGIDPAPRGLHNPTLEDLQHGTLLYEWKIESTQAHCAVQLVTPDAPPRAVLRIARSGECSEQLEILSWFHHDAWRRAVVILREGKELRLRATTLQH